MNEIPVVKGDEQSILNEAGFIDWIKSKFKDVSSFVGKTYANSGTFYLMTYQSKMFEEGSIDYFDTNPLILAFAQNPRYLWGVNLNYLPKNVKKNLLKHLQDRYPDQFRKNKPFPNLTWNTIKSDFEGVRVDFIVKMYIKDRIGTFVKLKNQDVVKVSDIQLGTFKGVSLSKVWQYYRAGIRPNIIPARTK